jgi:hypothetical protein
MFVSKKKYNALAKRNEDITFVVNSQRREMSSLYETIADLDGIIDSLQKEAKKKPAKKVAKKTTAKKKASK